MWLLLSTYLFIFMDFSISVSWKWQQTERADHFWRILEHFNPPSWSDGSTDGFKQGNNRSHVCHENPKNIKWTVNIHNLFIKNSPFQLKPTHSVLDSSAALFSPHVNPVSTLVCTLTHTFVLGPVQYWHSPHFSFYQYCSLSFLPTLILTKSFCYFSLFLHIHFLHTHTVGNCLTDWFEDWANFPILIFRS